MIQTSCSNVVYEMALVYYRITTEVNVSATVGMSVTVGEISATVGEMSTTVGEMSATVGKIEYRVGNLKVEIVIHDS